MVVFVCQRDIERKLGTHGGDTAGNMVRSTAQDATVTAPCEWTGGD